VLVDPQKVLTLLLWLVAVVVAKVVVVQVV
jgi:hypothetical protein